MCIRDRHIVAEVDGKPVTLLITPNEVEDHQSFGDQRFLGKMRKLAAMNFVMVAENLDLVDELYRQIKGA